MKIIITAFQTFSGLFYFDGEIIYIFKCPNVFCSDLTFPIHILTNECKIEAQVSSDPLLPPYNE